MNSENFCFWLQGFLEMTNTKSLDESQTAMLKEHLQLVFKKVTGTPPWAGLGGGVDINKIKDGALTVCGTTSITPSKEKETVFC